MIIESAFSEGRSFLYEYESKNILAKVGMSIAKSILAESDEEVISTAKNIGFPVVLKIVSPQILHKSDVGGVLLDIKNEREVINGYNNILNTIKSKMPKAKIKGILVQEMVPSSTEVIIGAIRDPQFGPTIMFGLGGIMTEIIRDVTFRIAPLTRNDAEDMIKGIKSYRILEGFRGLPKADITALLDILMILSKMMMEYPEIKTVDLNPTLIYEKGAKIVDARFILEKEGKIEKTHADITNFSAIFEPNSVAVIGASSNVEKIGYSILKNIIDAGFKGDIFPVNPRGGEILNLKAFPSVLQIQRDIDVVVIVVPAQIVPSVIEECVQKGVKGAIIISSGFRDVGPEGAALERKVLEIAKKGNLRIVGPNCQGMCNINQGFCATWPLINKIGNVSTISQSGTIALEVPSYLVRNELGYSKTIALGNKSDIDEADIILWLADDKWTKVIAVYSEGVAEGRKLMKAIKSASQKKPVLFLKGGKTEAGKRAVLAHTGSLAGMKEVFEAAIKQSGGICVNNLDELCDAAKAFSTLSIPKGNKLLIITSSGGSGILASDACEEEGLLLSNLSNNSLGKLEKNLPTWCVIGNPLDLTGNVLNNVHLYNESLKIVLDDESVDMVLLIFGDPIPNAYEFVKDEINKASTMGIPLAVAYLGGAEVQIDETQKFQQHGVPVFPTPNRAILALSYLTKYCTRYLRED